jgi:hypothetical protein
MRARPLWVKAPKTFVPRAARAFASEVSDYIKGVDTKGHHLVVKGSRVLCTRCRKVRGLGFSGWQDLGCGRVAFTTDRTITRPAKQPKSETRGNPDYEEDLWEEEEMEDDLVSREVAARLRNDNTRKRKAAKQGDKEISRRARSEAHTKRADRALTQGYLRELGEGASFPEDSPWYRAHPSHHLHVQSSGDYLYCSKCGAHSSLVVGSQMKKLCDGVAAHPGRLKRLREGLDPCYHPKHCSTFSALIHGEEGKRYRAELTYGVLELERPRATHDSTVESSANAAEPTHCEVFAVADQDTSQVEGHVGPNTATKKRGTECSDTVPLSDKKICSEIDLSIGRPVDQGTVSH